MPQSQWKSQEVNNGVYGEGEDEDVKVRAECILHILPLRSHSLSVDIILIFQGHTNHNVLQVKYKPSSHT